MSSNACKYTRYKGRGRFTLKLGGKSIHECFQNSYCSTVRHETSGLQINKVCFSNLARNTKLEILAKERIPTYKLLAMYTDLTFLAGPTYKPKLDQPFSSQQILVLDENGNQYASPDFNLRKTEIV